VTPQKCRRRRVGRELAKSPAESSEMGEGLFLRHV